METRADLDRRSRPLVVHVIPAAMHCRHFIPSQTCRASIPLCVDSNGAYFVEKFCNFNSIMWNVMNSCSNNNNIVSSDSSSVISIVLSNEAEILRDSQRHGSQVSPRTGTLEQVYTASGAHWTGVWRRERDFKNGTPTGEFSGLLLPSGTQRRL